MQLGLTVCISQFLLSEAASGLIRGCSALPSPLQTRFPAHSAALLLSALKDYIIVRDLHLYVHTLLYVGLLPPELSLEL